MHSCIMCSPAKVKVRNLRQAACRLQSDHHLAMLTLIVVQQIQGAAKKVADNAEPAAKDATDAAAKSAGELTENTKQAGQVS